MTVDSGKIEGSIEASTADAVATCDAVRVWTTPSLTRLDLSLSETVFNIVPDGDTNS